MSKMVKRGSEAGATPPPGPVVDRPRPKGRGEGGAKRLHRNLLSHGINDPVPDLTDPSPGFTFIGVKKCQIPGISGMGFDCGSVAMTG